MINKYFSYKEFDCKCGKCKRPKGVPSAELIKILTEIREYFDKPLIINSGYRCPSHNERVGGSPFSQHCFSQDTKILTQNGWKTYENIDLANDKVYSLNLQTNKIELVEIEDFFCYPTQNKPMFSFSNRYNDILVTDKHRVLYKKEKEGRKKNIDIWNIKEANNINLTRFRLFQGALKDGYTPNFIEFKYIMLCVAIICDGHIRKSGVVTFRLKKERKINRIKTLLKELNLTYNESTCKDNCIRLDLNVKSSKYFFNRLTPDKLIPMEWLEFSSETLRKIILEYCFFDGSYDTGYDYEILTSTNKRNIDLLHIMVCFSGWTGYLKVVSPKKYNIKGKMGISKKYYTLSITKKDSSVIRDYTPNISLYNGIVWCVSNKNTTLITKRNNKISIQGNCVGSAVDFTIRGVETLEVWDYVLSTYGKRPLGLAVKRNKDDAFKGFIHIDTRGKIARWEYA